MTDQSAVDALRAALVLLDAHSLIDPEDGNYRVEGGTWEAVRAALAASATDEPERNTLRAALHAHRDGCNGRPHRRWYRGENKCDTLARAVRAAARNSSSVAEAARTRRDLLDIMRRMDCQDLFDDAFYALVRYERAALAASATDEGPIDIEAEDSEHTEDWLDGYEAGWSDSRKSALAASATDEAEERRVVRDSEWTPLRKDARPAVPALDWPTLANVIREVDGNHNLGAGELAERILTHPKVLAASATDERGPSGPCIECGWHPGIWPEDSAKRADAVARHNAHAASATDEGPRYAIDCQFNHKHTFPECFDEGDR